MMLLFSDVLYMLVRYASPSAIMCLGCLMLTLSGPVKLLFYCRLELCRDGCYVGCLLFEYFSIYVSVCFVYFMLDCVGELFVECVCYMCGRSECFLFESYGVVSGLCWFLLASPCIVLQRICVLCL